MKDNISVIQRNKNLKKKPKNSYFSVCPESLTHSLPILFALLQISHVQNTVDSAFNELGFNEISEFLNIHFFKTDFS